MVEQDTSVQLQALAQVMSACRYEMTEFEGDAWMRVIQAVPKDRFLSFLSHHYSTSPFAPKPSDATKYLDMAINPEVAFAKLREMVGTFGPWQVPPVVDPLMICAIQHLGGWCAVNEQLPDVSNTFETRAYRERFEAAFNQAIAQVRIEKRLPEEPLKALGTHSPSLALTHSSRVSTSFIHRQKVSP